VKLFQQKLTKDEYKKLWASNNTGIGEVLVALQHAKKTYDERKAKQSGVRTLLSIFSSRLVYYGAILDTVSKNDWVSRCYFGNGVRTSFAAGFPSIQ
jgi:hypothetical protein